MRFKFPLQKVMQHRKTVEDQAQTEFQQALAVMNNEIEKLTQMEQSVIAARDGAFHKQNQGGKASPALVQVADFIRGQDIRMAQQRDKIKQCESIVENLREILRQKAIDYKIIEELRDRKKQEFKVAQGKLEQKRSDEMNVMRFRREKSEEESGK